MATMLRSASASTASSALDDDGLPPLRAKSLGRIRNPLRMAARELGIRSLARAAASVSNAQLGEKFGGELAGAQIREGSIVVSFGEVAALFPIPVFLSLLIDLTRERLAVESISDATTPGAAQRLALIRVHLDAIDVLRNL